MIINCNIKENFMLSIKKYIKLFFNLLGYEILKYNHSLALDLHLKYLINKLEIDLIIDVGANVGQFALMCRKLGYRGKIISFEPVESTFNILKIVSDTDSNWQCYNFALGNESKTSVIKKYNSTLFSSFYDVTDYAKTRFSDEISTFDEQCVEIRPLDDFLLDFESSKSIFLKMDTQGFDLNVFKGSLKNIDRIRLLLSELSFIPIYESMPSYIQSMEFFNNHGYNVSGLFPMNFNEDSSVVEMDAVFIKKS
jgi:FkbM family methyltransferase